MYHQPFFHVKENAHLNIIHLIFISRKKILKLKQHSIKNNHTNIVYFNSKTFNLKRKLASTCNMYFTTITHILKYKMLTLYHIPYYTTKWILPTLFLQPQRLINSTISPFQTKFKLQVLTMKSRLKQCQ